MTSESSSAFQDVEISMYSLVVFISEKHSEKQRRFHHYLEQKVNRTSPPTAFLSRQDLKRAYTTE